MHSPDLEWNVQPMGCRAANCNIDGLPSGKIMVPNSANKSISSGKSIPFWHKDHPFGLHVIRAFLTVLAALIGALAAWRTV
jgi:hypothetical protein